MRREAALLSSVAGFARQSFPGRFVHCTCVSDLRQVLNQDAVPGVELIEMSLRQSGGTG